VLDLGDVQSPTVLEALIEEGRRRHITRPKNRQGVREALIHYAEDRLKEARGRERQFSEKIGALLNSAQRAPGASLPRFGSRIPDRQSVKSRSSSNVAEPSLRKDIG
jgi:hypothetical protein